MEAPPSSVLKQGHDHQEEKELAEEDVSIAEKKAILPESALRMETTTIEAGEEEEEEDEEERMTEKGEISDLGRTAETGTTMAHAGVADQIQAPQ